MLRNTRVKDYSSFVMKRSYVWQTHNLKMKMGGNEIEIDFVLVVKSNRKYLKDVKAIHWELQHQLVVTDIDKKS